ncbi:mitochondrial PGP phosphatase-domain-containing protein [Gautieria morchelliformis]|nr:mitochondrial PGP phosphatase-domain-containing protein [Gautieria morchelliformis]
MPFNLAGTLAVFHALVRPRLIIPNLTVQDIRSLNFAAFRRAGYKGVVLDKDNCLTLPHQDTLIPELDTAWRELKHEFDAHNLLIVSNSAGTRYDAGGLAAESVSHNLGVPVLRHSSMKPSRRTMTAIQRYFASICSPAPDPGQLIVIGDRALTDVVLANRLGAYSVLVSRDWKSAVMSRAAGASERAAVSLAQWLSPAPQAVSGSSDFVKEVGKQKDEVKVNHSGSTWTWAGRALGIGPNSGKRC